MHLMHEVHFSFLFSWGQVSQNVLLLLCQQQLLLHEGRLTGIFLLVYIDMQDLVVMELEKHVHVHGQRHDLPSHLVLPMLECCGQSVMYNHLAIVSLKTCRIQSRVF